MIAPRPVWRFAFLAAGLLACSPASSEDCRGSIGPETSIAGKTPYDPFSPADVADEHRISLRNSGGSACRYALRLRPRSARPQLGGTLTYSIEASESGAMLIGSGSAGVSLARLKAPLAAGAVGYVPLQIVIPRGQFARPGTYGDTVDLELLALDEGGRIQGTPLQSTALQIAYTVPQVMSVNIKGAELATTLSFGTLAKGQERRVEIQARSNQAYRLEVSSDNRGALALTPRVPGQQWAVPYSAALGGKRLDLTRAASLHDLPPTRPESDAGYPLTVTIGEVGQKRAGRYEDVITVEIKPVTP